VLSDEEYSRERRMLARRAEYLRDRERARQERAEGASLGEALGSTISRLKEGQT